MERHVNVTPLPECVENDIFVNLLAEHVSAYSQTREDNLTSALISPPSCLFSFSFFSSMPLSRSPSSSLLFSPFMSSLSLWLPTLLPVVSTVYLTKSLRFCYDGNLYPSCAASGSCALIVLLSPLHVSVNVRVP